MRHRKAGTKLGRKTPHRRSLLRSLVTSIIIEDRIETTVAKAKAARPLIEKMIHPGQARRPSLAPSGSRLSAHPLKR